MLFPTAAGGLFVRNEVFRTGPGAAALNNVAGGEIAQSFVRSYYDIFDADRRALAGIYVSALISWIRVFGRVSSAPSPRLPLTISYYATVLLQRPSSMLLFEGVPAVGPEAVLEKLSVCCAPSGLCLPGSHPLSCPLHRPCLPPSTRLKPWMPNPCRTMSSTC